jgi:hypothetical protein
MPSRDSLDKVVTSYFAAVTAVPFTYNSVRFEPKPLLVSPLLLRGYTCPSMCGGCCPRFSLDYLPNEMPAPATRERSVRFDGREFLLQSDMQFENRGHFCQHLDRTGRCGIYNRRPFSCDFELIRCCHYRDKVVMTQKLFGRGWAMKRIDGLRGARCGMTPATDETVQEVARKLRRLDDWAKHFELETRLPPIIRWVENGGSTLPLRL